MNGKIEISRELAERLAIKHATGITDPCTIRTINAQFFAAIKELRALLAAPVVERQEPVQWQRKSKMHGDCWYPLPEDEVKNAIASGWEIRGLYTSPPAPVSVVSVVLPDNLESHRNTWIQAMERLVELEPESCAPDEDEKGFWRHELQAMRDMYTDLDKLQAPTQCP